ncbi:MAG: 1-acyl-sn-glycerol-3-phosphate acyltransferase [Acidimicrobiaceae bacterium]|nr:1-acyl-sn-glycerol-3-phosphate acyltransferase [Acidimicrobiaceae bacterium]MYE97715.1 1-acyl-sn-glycerol-3-phosphate acyltransferase [Acidimicrobiaceae bacterium]MYI54545.1 1-acyl-sn-glycerol-3-phosphate acyltransferase [Acidimicrobiaceae bacterium]
MSVVDNHRHDTSEPKGRRVEDLQQRAQHIAAKRSSMWVYRSVRRTIMTVLYPYFRVRRRGKEHLDIEGPVIVAPVHRSNLDTPLLSGMSRRRLRALSKESLFSNRYFGAFLAALGAFPVRRGAADREAMREAVKMLEAGEQMVVFPEGTRQTGARVGEVFDGMSYLASRTGAAIVPVGIAGTEAAMSTVARLPRPVRVAMVAGSPIRPPEGRMTRPEMRRFSEMVRERLQEVFDEAQALAG